MRLMMNRLDAIAAALKVADEDYSKVILAKAVRQMPLDPWHWKDFADTIGVELGAVILARAKERGKL